MEPYRACSEASEYHKDGSTAQIVQLVLGTGTEGVVETGYHFPSSYPVTYMTLLTTIGLEILEREFHIRTPMFTAPCNMQKVICIAS